MKRKLPKLAFDLRRFAQSHPAASVELADFFLKHAHDEYVSALRSPRARRVTLPVQSREEADLAIRSALLLADQILLTWAVPDSSPGLSFFPVPDSFSSPVLGLLTALDENGERPVNPVEVALLALDLAVTKSEHQGPAQILGVDWSSGESVWQRGKFTRTGEPFKNAKGQRCRIASGFVHPVPDDLYRWLLEDAFAPMAAGRLVPAPFLAVAGDSERLSVAKSSLIHSSVCSFLPQPSHSAQHLLASLEIPYLRNVPLDLLNKVLDDEEPSLKSFRLAVSRALEDVRDAQDPAESTRIIRALQREEIEDELERVKNVYRRIAQKNSMARIGAYVATGGLSIAAILGLDPASLVCGTAAATGAAIAEAHRYFGDRSDVAQSSMHFVWRLGRSLTE